MAESEEEAHYSAPIAAGVKVSAGTTQKGALDGLEVVVISFSEFPDKTVAVPVDAARFLAFQLFIELGLCHEDEVAFKALAALHATGVLQSHSKTLREIGQVELADVLDKIDEDMGEEI